MLLCFCGVIGIALSKQSDKQLNADTDSSQLFGIGVAFVMSWFYAACNVINRKLKDVHFTVVGFYHPIIGALMALTYIFVNFILTG